MTMIGPAQEAFLVTVERVDALGERIKAFLLRRADGQPLPGFSAGAHISVRIPAGGGRAQEGWRAYSLIDFGADDTTGPQESYLIGVRRNDPGKGGSRYLHDEVRPGDRLLVRTAANGFPLDEPGGDGVALLAGGIGVTPIITMAAALKRRGARFELHYTARTAGEFIYQDEIRALAGETYFAHADDDPATAFAAADFVASLAPGQPLYVCGPEGLIDAVFAAARASGWSDDRLHCELFGDAKPKRGDVPFVVDLESSGLTLTVPADKSLLDVLLGRDLSVMHDCRQGYCGLCSVTVLSGEIDHRDTFLTDDEKARGRTMQACVSRGKGRLSLDL